jgi:hypothetical protein
MPAGDRAELVLVRERRYVRNPVEEPVDADGGEDDPPRRLAEVVVGVDELLEDQRADVGAVPKLDSASIARRCAITAVQHESRSKG